MRIWIIKIFFLYLRKKRVMENNYAAALVKLGLLASATTLLLCNFPTWAFIMMILLIFDAV